LKNILGVLATALNRLVINNLHDIMYFVLIILWKFHWIVARYHRVGWDRKRFLWTILEKKHSWV